MKLATAYIIFVAILFTYGHFDKQRDHRDVRSKESSRQLVKSDRELERARQVKEVQTFLSGTLLENEAETFVDASYVYGLDYKLLPSIAGQESTFGKFTPSCAPYNPFGYSSTTSPCGFWRFKSYDEAIWKVAQTIGTNSTYARYRETGQITELAEKYNLGETHWINSVTYFYEKIN